MDYVIVVCLAAAVPFCLQGIGWLYAELHKKRAIIRTEALVRLVGDDKLQRMIMQDARTIVRPLGRVMANAFLCWYYDPTWWIGSDEKSRRIRRAISEGDHARARQLIEGAFDES